ncbi:hypothetical protein P167DRAFT_537633 [Morchella conica CCBAS932]|uniref:Uncharacterized protein n=1 Tax=Morchella conica CCBAS932 TaxID=1392247 RepID=A0A3N4KIS0_9PEZI|nr:hypothetical protein P167DRAFT_537633 [Morchella conica CCBAS932]
MDLRSVWGFFVCFYVSWCFVLEHSIQTFLVVVYLCTPQYQKVLTADQFGFSEPPGYGGIKP